MQQIFIDNNDIVDDKITVTGDDANHLINAVRIKAGEQIRVSTSSEESYLCEVDTTSEGVLVLKVIDTLLSTELSSRITLYQAIPKGDRMETILEKCTELGAYRIVPIEMERCVVKLDDKKKAKRLERYERIAESAAQQSKRSCIPCVVPFMTLDEAIKESESADILRIVPYENKNGMTDTVNVLNEVKNYKEIAVFIGPEGGFAPKEIEALQVGENTKLISLGKRILRTDTAAITMVAALMIELEKTEIK